jgi:spore maturation protein CgeB
VAPADHPAFYSASRFTLNVTRADMIAAGYSPSVRLFEAAACGVPIISDVWPGLDELFEPGREIALATDTAAVLGLLNAPPHVGERLGAAGRARILGQHTAHHRALELERHLREALVRGPASPSHASEVSRLCRSLRRPKPSPSWSPAAPASSDRTSASA